MNWLAENWFWVLIGIAFVGMHLFGHGKHGGHGGGGGGHGCHGGHGSHDTPGPESSDAEKNEPSEGHGH